MNNSIETVRTIVFMDRNFSESYGLWAFFVENLHLLRQNLDKWRGSWYIRCSKKQKQYAVRAHYHQRRKMDKRRHRHDLFFAFFISRLLHIEQTFNFRKDITRRAGGMAALPGRFAVVQITHGRHLDEDRRGRHHSQENADKVDGY